jgi:glycosyltransferase involved in cell wall biosynthesis
VIETSNAGASDLVTDGENGFVVPPRDVHAIREKLDFLAANPAKLRAMGTAAAESVKSLTLENFRNALVPRALALCR